MTKLDWPSTKWRNRYFVFVGDTPEVFGPWKPPATKRKPLPKKQLDWRVGEYAYHKKFGVGVVCKVEQRMLGEAVRVKFRRGPAGFTYSETLQKLRRPSDAGITIKNQ